MKKTLIIISEDEEIVKSFNTSKLRVVITEKRLIIENKLSAYSFLLNDIGGAELVKNGSKCNLRLYSHSGENFFASVSKKLNGCIEFLKADEAAAFENVLGCVLCKKD